MTVRRVDRRVPGTREAEGLGSPAAAAAFLKFYLGLGEATVEVGMCAVGRGDEPDHVLVEVGGRRFVLAPPVAEAVASVCETMVEKAGDVHALGDLAFSLRDAAARVKGALMQPLAASAAGAIQ